MMCGWLRVVCAKLNTRSMKFKPRYYPQVCASFTDAGLWIAFQRTVAGGSSVSNASHSNSNIIRMNELVPSSLVDLVASDSFLTKDRDQLTRPADGGDPGRTRHRLWRHRNQPALRLQGSDQGGQRRWLAHA
jgi:hypothetical protein